MKHTPPLKYFITSDRTYWNHILGFRVWACLSSKWLKWKKSDEPFFRNCTYDFSIIFSWFSLKGLIRFFRCQSILTQGGPNFETYYMASMCPVKNVNFSKGRGALKNAIFVNNGRRPNLTWYSSTNDRYATGFWSPFLSTTSPSYHTCQRYSWKIKVKA